MSIDVHAATRAETSGALTAGVPAHLRAIGIRDVRFGAGVTVVEPANLFGCSIGDGAFIGPFVEVQRNAVIGRRTKIQSHAFVCELVTIGDDCFIGHGVMFVNDLFDGGGPAGGDRSKWKATFVGNRVSIGSNATILPVRICDGAVIGAGAVVTRDIDVPGTYLGNPARLRRTFSSHAIEDAA
jgi:acetyltransferase-like isoleucine patch superfamily enzyme